MKNGNGDERSTIQLLKDLRDEVTGLVRQEVALARTETSEKIAHLVRNGALLAAAGVVGAYAFLFVLLCLTGAAWSLLRLAGVSPGVVVWLAPLIIAVLLGGAAGTLALKGVTALRRETPAPEKTVQSLKEDAAWLKNRMS